MNLFNKVEITEYLVQRKVIQLGDEIELVPLPGGISSDVAHVVYPGGAMVLKQALPRLKVAQEWYASTSRNDVERRCLVDVGALAPEFVPRVLFHDEASGLFAMEYVDGPNWKQQLLNGLVDTNTAQAAASFLGYVHNWTRLHPQMLDLYKDKTLFHQLRIAPYFLAIQSHYPRHSRAIDELVDVLMNASDVLVHGDFSPKNILVTETGPIVLDWEVAHAGHPAFDLGFLLHHLMLKAIYNHPQQSGRILDLARMSYEAYFDAAESIPEPNYRGVVTSLVGALMLARVDGKSPVEYLTDDMRATAREQGLALLSGGRFPWR